MNLDFGDGFCPYMLILDRCAVDEEFRGGNWVRLNCMPTVTVNLLVMKISGTSTKPNEQVSFSF